MVCERFVTGGEMQIIRVTLILSLAAAVVSGISCKTIGGADDGTLSNANSNTSTASAVAPTPSPRTFEAAILVTAVKANEPEFSKLVGKDPIIVVGDVWTGTDDGFRYRLEYWGREGRINCSELSNSISPEKAGLWRTLQKATGDYLSNKVKRMPIVKAKGTYASSAPPSAKPNDYWSVSLENCDLMEV